MRRASAVVDSSGAPHGGGEEGGRKRREGRGKWTGPGKAWSNAHVLHQFFDFSSILWSRDLITEYLRGFFSVKNTCHVTFCATKWLGECKRGLKLSNLILSGTFDTL